MRPFNSTGATLKMFRGDQSRGAASKGRYGGVDQPPGSSARVLGAPKCREVGGPEFSRHALRECKLRLPLERGGVLTAVNRISDEVLDGDVRH